MLSRVAQRIYWIARYLERAENTARSVNVNGHLLLDLPKDVSLGWEPLIEMTGAAERYARHYRSYREQNVVQFLLSDRNNPGSLLCSLDLARENARATRDVIPSGAWEGINRLYLDACDALPDALARRNRQQFLARIIESVQRITGAFAGTMLHDAGYQFLRMGRNLERADMTTRIIDVRSGSLIQNRDDRAGAWRAVQWMSVLRSLTAYESYERLGHGPVERARVLRMLICERTFPRAVAHCVAMVETCLSRLPNSEDIQEQAVDLLASLAELDVDGVELDDLHELVESLQADLHALHDALAARYFRAEG
jgi:uncharacterized alpha-E superfamily protein